jgi:glycosyltransferase involved in cell wall biosynthesis
MQPRISVIIKSYNHAAYVRQAIQSILDQSCQDFEIVVTDDGSNDATPDIVRQFSDPRIHLEVFRKNRGISAAMNATIGRARGEFIAILNSDDFALPGRLERQLRFLELHPEVAGLFGLPRVVDEYGQPTQSYFDFETAFSLPDFSRKTILRHFFFTGNFLCAPTAMIRRSVYSDVGDYDRRLTNLQDFDMWVRVCTGHNIHIMREELTAYRIRANAQNMGAPRPESRLRSQFEYAKILKRYLAMDPALLHTLFADDLVANHIDADGRHELWLAELAVTIPSAAHRLFALETYFDAVKHGSEFARFRDLAGSVDVFGLLKAEEYRSYVNDQRVLGETTRKQIEKLQAESSELAIQLDTLAIQLDTMKSSTCWRITRPLRQLRHIAARFTGRCG